MLPPILRRREVFAWALYDWANSAYSTLSITLLVWYIQTVVFPAGRDGTLGAVVWAWGIALSMLVAAILSPLLGAVADARASKRQWLAATALGGAGTAMALALVPPDWRWTVTGLFFATSLLFELSLGFYNGFLPEIADEGELNRVSAWGYGVGYLGGAAALLLAVALRYLGPRLGLPDPVAQTRAGLFIMGAWWGLFTLPVVAILRDRGEAAAPRQPLPAALRTAAGEVGRTLANIRRYRALALFLLGFLLYNDGIQTVISQSSTFALRELRFSAEELIGLILLVQLLAIPGALLIGRLSDRWGQRPALMLCLAVWVVLLAAAWLVESKQQFWLLAATLALVLGGTQSVSRAIMGRMTPAAHTAEFFGFFNLSGKATGFVGTFTFGLIVQLTDSPRLAIVSLLVFFLAGWAIAARVDIEAGQRAAKEE